MLLFSAFFLVCYSEEIYQTSSLYTSNIYVTSDISMSDLKVTIQKANPSDSLLLLAAPNSLRFELVDHQWVYSTSSYDIDGWALQSSSNSLRIHSEQMLAGSYWMIGVYNPSPYPVSYSLTLSMESFSSCDCSSHGRCQGGSCVCDAFFRGDTCSLELQSIALDSRYRLNFDQNEWRFYIVYLSDQYERLTFVAQRERGNPYVFLDTIPTDQSPPPSMFHYTSYMYFAGASEYKHSFSHNGGEYWLIAVYCYQDDCEFYLEIETSLETNEGVVWLMVIMVVSVAFLCFLIPFVIKIFIRLRSTAPIEHDPEYLISNQMNQRYPARNWQEVKNGITETCAICLDDFRSDALVRELFCKHVFHADCIDSWAINKANCPLCKDDMENNHRPTENSNQLFVQDL